MYIIQRCFLLVSCFLFIFFFNSQLSHRNTRNRISVYNFKSDWHCGAQGKTYQGQIQKIQGSGGGCVGHLPAIKILFISTRNLFKNYEAFQRKRRERGALIPIPNSPMHIHPVLTFFLSGTSSEEGVGICFSICENLLKKKVIVKSLCPLLRLLLKTILLYQLRLIVFTLIV